MKLKYRRKQKNNLIMSEKRKPSNRPASTANASATVKAIKHMQRAKADR